MYHFLVPSQVFNLTATNISSTSIVVTWLGPLHPNGVITQYRISVKKEEKENNTQQINFYCIDCQRPCPKPDFSNEVQYMPYLKFSGINWLLTFANMEILKREKNSKQVMISLGLRFPSYSKYVQITSIFQRVRYKSFRKEVHFSVVKSLHFFFY